jgi:glutamate racemase
MLGLFDSGLGGLTVVRQVRALLPHHALLFLADQAHVPYGDRAPDDLHRLLVQNLRWLDGEGAEAIVMACNTSCAIAAEFGYPQVGAPILDLIESAAIAASDAGYRRIGVVATAATVRTGAYAKKIRQFSSAVRVDEVAAPALVPLVEAGDVDGEVARAAVAEACSRLPKDVDAVILACTHYPVLDAHFAGALGPSVARIDPAIEQAGRAAALVAARSIPAGAGHTRYVTTGDVEAFRASVHRLMDGGQHVVEMAAP